MNASLKISLLTAFITVAAKAQCFRASQPLLRVDFDHDGNADWYAYIVAARDNSFPEPLPEYYRVRTILDVGNSASVLRAVAGGRIDFNFGEMVSTNHPIYFIEHSGFADLELLRYRCSDVTPSENLQGEFMSNLSALVGAKYTDPDTGDVTLGWFKFSRPSTARGTAFTLESWAYSPIPNEPIRAGFPPDLPAPQVTFSGENRETLDVSWPAKAAMLRLETTDSLTPPVQWKPVETGGATAVTLPAGEAQGTFFRLVAPEL